MMIPSPAVSVLATCLALAAVHLAMLPRKPVVLVRDREAPAPDCQWRFDRYVPSDWEAQWTAGVAELQRDVCAHTDSAKAAAWVERMDDAVLSHFHFTHSCSGERVVQPVEPLVGLTRHPYFCLRGDAFVVNKSYMVPAAALVSRSTGRFFYFDFGASLYDQGGGGSSQQWVVETYARVNWDGIWAWEGEQHGPADVWRRIPKRLHPVYHWYNTLAEETDPLVFINAVAAVSDYVVLKIDIDNSPVETAMMRRLLESPRTLALIDELYFEHHVDVQPMWPFWGRVPGTELADTYRLFSELRNRGVVAHSWV